MLAAGCACGGGGGGGGGGIGFRFGAGGGGVESVFGVKLTLQPQAESTFGFSVTAKLDRIISSSYVTVEPLRYSIETGSINTSAPPLLITLHHTTQHNTSQQPVSQSATKASRNRSTPNAHVIRFDV